MSDGHGISKETFVKASSDPKIQAELTFDLLDNIYRVSASAHQETITHRKHCDKRFNKLENRKRFDTAVASGSGIIGGFIAMVVKFIFWGK